MQISLALPGSPGEPAAMTVPLLTLMVLLIAFTAEVGWLCRC